MMGESNNPCSSPRRPRVALALFALFAALCVAVSLSPLKSGYAEGARFDAPTDIDLYNAEVERMRQGDGYYEAAAAELRARGYPTRSVFNWRLPLPLALIATLPYGVAQTILGGFAVALIAGSVLLLAREGRPGSGLLCGLLMFGAVMPVFLDRLYVMPVLWAGVFIGLSLVSYGFDRRHIGLAFGLAALFCRELAGPYCLLCACFAAYERRWKELAVWAVGFVAYAAYFAWHAMTVLALIGPGDVSHDGSWLQFGGLPFVISLVQLNAYLLVSPQWLAGLYFAAAMLGFAASNSPSSRTAAVRERRSNALASARISLTACLYVALFAAVGHSFNQYWGALIAPLFCLGAARFPSALRQLLSAARPARDRFRLESLSDSPIS